MNNPERTTFAALNLAYFLMKSVERIKREKNLDVSWIRTNEELTSAGEKGLFSMYCDIFAEDPYYEKFTSSEVKDYFKGIVNANGFIFTANTPRKGSPSLLTAFVASQPLESKPAVIPAVSPYVDTNNSSYFAEDAVIPERRRQGISRAMKTLLLEANQQAGYKTMVLRTSAESFRQAAAVQQLGANKIDNLYQDVESLRLNGEMVTDRRIFFTFDLGKFNPTGAQ